ANVSTMPPHPPWEPTLSLSFSQPTPCRSSCECTRSTRVLPLPSSRKVTSTRLALDGSGRYLKSDPRGHETTTRVGGEYSSTRPQSHSEPSVPRSYQRPPLCGSRIAVNGSTLPMWWERGHHVSNFSVKTLNACAIGALTTTDFRTLVS